MPVPDRSSSGWRGDWDRARAYAEEVLLVAEQADSRMMQRAPSPRSLGLLDASRGLADAARMRLVDAIALCDEVGDRSYTTYARHVLGFLELSVGNADGRARTPGSLLASSGGIEGTKRICLHRRRDRDRSSSLGGRPKRRR